jgi:hypothetical protein
MNSGRDVELLEGACERKNLERDDRQTNIGRGARRFLAMWCVGRGKQFMGGVAGAWDAAKLNGRVPEKVLDLPARRPAGEHTRDNAWAYPTEAALTSARAAAQAWGPEWTAESAEPRRCCFV